MKQQQATLAHRKDTRGLVLRVFSQGQLGLDILYTGVLVAHLAAQCQRPHLQQAHMPAPGKTTRTKCFPQPSKSQLKMSLEHYQKSTA